MGISSFNNFVGQNNVIERILILIKGSKIQNIALSHILLIGPPGIGKTTIAQLIAEELQVNFHSLEGTSINKTSDIISILANIKQSDIVFIDEIHVVNYEILEVLYSALEGNFINIMIGKDYNNKIVKINLPSFTFIGATNKVGILTKALISRIPNILQLSDYNYQDIKSIISQVSLSLNWKLENNIINIIANHCRNIPRLIINIIKQLYNYCVVMNVDLNETNILQILFFLQIYPLGLNSLQLAYLALFNNVNLDKSLSIETICQLLNEERKNLEIHYEPWLIHCGLITKTTKGRKITIIGKEYINNNIILFRK
ncbi:Holliday junction branch migration DNA helicase RuvB [Spiroplasma endosymbiont of Tricholauxania praeusta]|uniref:Holliday junction branch migration DNA helicase RuvB n=1 Tax=Spiroplasma endosymbiont of Tricholauxania praeusta TaxID=3066296 RepID=UPI0030CF4532